MPSPSSWTACFNPRAHVGRDKTVFVPHTMSKFQSTRPRGARPTLAALEAAAGSVSIHAPTWGATSSAGWSKPVVSFNPRAHVGRDRVARKLLGQEVFQSTRPRGARQVERIWMISRVCFNPRAHVGRDCRVARKLLGQEGFNPRAHVGRDSSGLTSMGFPQVSIHAPTWGATCCWWQGGFHREVVSIHAPTWGATEDAFPLIVEVEFQSTRPRGARQPLLECVLLPERFNPRAHVGRDHCLVDNIAHRPKFQSTRPRGARLSTSS